MEFFRAIPPVALPELLDGGKSAVQWDEIDDLRGGSHWTVRDVQPRVDEAMAAATKAADTRSAQSLSGAARALEVPGFR